MEFRKIYSFFINVFEKFPFSKVLISGGLPKFRFNVKGNVQIIANVLKKCNIYYIIRWVPGFLTNLKIMFYKWERQEILKLNKKSLKKEMRMGIITMESLPSIVIFLSISSIFQCGVLEAKKLRIPMIGIIDADNKEFGITYKIHGNDDDFITFSYYSYFFRKTIEDGKLVGKNLIGNVFKYNTFNLDAF